MSLLYECINGVIQGGILEGVNNIREGEEIATLCVSKLRGMIMVEGDPNCGFFALLHVILLKNLYSEVCCPSCVQ